MKWIQLLVCEWRWRRKERSEIEMECRVKGTRMKEMTECDRLEQDTHSTVSFSPFLSSVSLIHTNNMIHIIHNTSLWTWRWHSNAGTQRQTRRETWSEMLHEGKERKRRRNWCTHSSHQRRERMKDWMNETVFPSSSCKWTTDWLNRGLGYMWTEWLLLLSWSLAIA